MRYKACLNPDCHEKLPLDSKKQYHDRNCWSRHYRSLHHMPSTNLKSFENRQCLNCGKTFTTNRSNQVFDSVSCRVSHFQQMKRLKVKESENAESTE
jgi:hypothetical protein